MTFQVSGSYHTHSTYCDGKGTVREVVEAGIARGLRSLGFSSHAPLPFQTDWTMPLASLGRYLDEIGHVRSRHLRRIELLVGAELDFIPDDRVRDFQTQEVLSKTFDYFVGSVHFLGSRFPPQAFDGSPEDFECLLQEGYAGDIRMMTEEYYRRITEMASGSDPRVRIVGHFDVIKRWNGTRSYFAGDEPWYRDQVEHALTAVQRAGLLIELNTAGWRKGLGEPYPAAWILQLCRDLRIPVIVSSDAHLPEDVCWGFERALALLDELNIAPVSSPRS